MRMMKVLMVFAFVILFTGIISAGFSIGNLSHSITKQYGQSQNLKGWVNLSLTSEPSNSIFIDSLENSISLINLLKLNPNLNYNCSIKNCISDYSASNLETQKTFNLPDNQEKLIGFRFHEEITDITSINFTIESDTGAWCYNQLEIDYFNDDEIDTGNTKTSATSCQFLRRYGCFDFSKEEIEGTITNVPYCQKIKLTKSPGFSIGAWIKEKTPGDKKIKMALYSTAGEDLEKTCELNKTGISQNGGNVSCGITFLVTEEKEHYVCIYSDSGTGEYKIRGYSSSEQSKICGFKGFPALTENAAYEIFAEGKAFDPLGTLTISNSLPYGNTFGGVVRDYIQENYGSLDCSSKECIVPLNFVSGKNQSITIKNLSIKYDTEFIVGAEKNDFYDIIETPAKINMGFQKILLDNANFSMPAEYGNFTYYLNLNGMQVFSEKITIERVPTIQGLYPLKTASAYPTEFKVIVNASANITKYEWDFGDYKTETTTANKLTHTYNSTGSYQLKISVTDSKQRTSSRIFEIIVDSPKEVINTTIKEMQEDLDNVKKQIDKFSEFQKKSLNSVLDIENLDSELGQIQRDYKQASSEEEYNNIIPFLLDIKTRIPESISITKSADKLSLYPTEEIIDMNILQLISGESYETEQESKYIDSIITWNMENIQTTLNFIEFSAQYKGESYPIIKTFDITIKEINDLTYDSYFILKKLDTLEFKEEYLEKEESGYISISLTEPETNIEFSTTEDIDFTELPAFISPDINRLSIDTSCIDCNGEPKSKWKTFALIMFLLFMSGLIIYTIMQQWYKRKYEIHLFKNRNNLYNLVIYIENSRKKGVSDKEISSKLKKAGWNSEQITYAMKKHAGKRTGMYELPFWKIIDKIKGRGMKKQKVGFDFSGMQQNTQKFNKPF